MRQSRSVPATERGAVMIEFALCVPLIVLLLFGIIEFGFGYRDSLTVSAATRSGARVASNAGDDPTADFLALLQIEAALAELPTAAALQKVIIYKPINAAGDVDPSCLSVSAMSNGGVAGKCNVYSPAQMAALNLATYNSGNWAQKFPPTTRETRQSVGTTWLGVRVIVERDMATDLIGVDSLSLDHVAVFRLEPRVEP